MPISYMTVLATTALVASAGISLAQRFSNEIPYRVSGINELKAYHSPDTSSRVTARLPKGTAGIFISGNCLGSTDWCIVERDGKQLGWVRARYLAGYAD